MPTIFFTFLYIFKKNIGIGWMNSVTILDMQMSKVPIISGYGELTWLEPVKRKLVVIGGQGVGPICL